MLKSSNVSDHLCCPDCRFHISSDANRCLFGSREMLILDCAYEGVYVKPLHRDADRQMDTLPLRLRFGWATDAFVHEHSLRVGQNLLQETFCSSARREELKNIFIVRLWYREQIAVINNVLKAYGYWSHIQDTLPTL